MTWTEYIQSLLDAAIINQVSAAVALATATTDIAVNSPSSATVTVWEVAWDDLVSANASVFSLQAQLIV